MRSGCGAVGLPESFENVGQDVLTDSDTVISYCNLSLAVAISERDIDVASAWRELDRIRQQVPENLLEAAGVTRDWRNFRIKIRSDRETLGVRRNPHGIDCGLY